MIVSHPLAIPWYLFFKSVNQSEPSLCYTISPTSGFVKNCSKRVTDRLQGEQSSLLMGLLSRTWKCSINNNLKKTKSSILFHGKHCRNKSQIWCFPLWGRFVSMRGEMNVHNVTLWAEFCPHKMINTSAHLPVASDELNMKATLTDSCRGGVLCCSRCLDTFYVEKADSRFSLTLLQDESSKAAFHSKILPFVVVILPSYWPPFCQPVGGAREQQAASLQGPSQAHCALW